MNNRKPYKETGNIYSVSAEIRRRKQEKRERRNRILLWIFSISVVAVMTFGLHAYSVWRNGYDGIGGEAMIPVIAILGYLSYRQMKADEKRRQKYRESLERKIRENMVKEFREYDRIRKISKEEKMSV